MSLIKNVVNSLYGFGITFVFYVVFFSGIPQISDEDLFLSAAKNIGVTGNLAAPEVYGSTRLQGDYHGVEPAHPVLASFWYRFVSPILPVGRTQGLYILPILYTSLTAGLLVVLSTQMNYSVRTGVVAGILFGISTIALPYAKTFYRETLASFLMILTWVTFESSLKNKYFPTRVLLVSAVVFLTALILLTKIVLGFFVFSFIVMLILRTNDKDNQNIRSIFLFVVLVFATVSLIFIGLFKIQFSSVTFYRFTAVFIHDAIGRYQNIGHGYFWEAFFAPLISPWKGFFVYSPICFVAFLSFGKLYARKQMYLIVIALVTLVGLSVTHALAYDKEWWTSTWSARHLLPCVPLFVVASLPWVEEALENLRSPHGIGLLAIFVFGTLIQLGAVIFNPMEYNWSIFEKGVDISTEVVWNIAKAPMWGQWSLVRNGIKPDMVIWRLFENKNIALLVVVGLVLFLAWLLFVFWRDLNNIQGVVDFKKTALSVTLIALSLFIFIGFYGEDPYYDLHSPQIAETCSELNKRVTQNDIVLIKPYRSRIWFYFMNSNCLKYEWYSLPYNIEMKNDPDARDITTRLIDEKVSFADRVWLVNQVWSEPDLAREMLQKDGYRLIESRKYPLDDTTIIFDLYIKNGN